MNQEEFKTLTTELFVRYPSLYEWLTEKSPDAKATLQSWFRRLQNESLADCMAVLDEWEAGNKEPFKAYERDQVPSIVKSVLARQRDRKAKAEREREQNELSNHYRRYRQQKQQGEPRKVSGLLDADSRRAMEWLKPFHLELLEGEISRVEYEVKKEEAWEKFGFNQPVEAEQWSS